MRLAALLLGVISLAAPNPTHTPFPTESMRVDCAGARVTVADWPSPVVVTTRFDGQVVAKSVLADGTLFVVNRAARGTVSTDVQYQNHVIDRQEATCSR